MVLRILKAVLGYMVVSLGSSKNVCMVGLGVYNGHTNKAGELLVFKCSIESLSFVIG